MILTYIAVYAATFLIIYILYNKQDFKLKERDVQLMEVREYIKSN